MSFPSEIHHLLLSVFDRYGYDFRRYAPASLERQIERFKEQKQYESYTKLCKALLNQEDLFAEFVMSMTVQVTEMFRDPSFYLKIKTDVLPILATYPRIKIWHAGCSSGEEVYSLAILLHEAGILHKSLLYATDINQQALAKAAAGCYPLRDMQRNTRNYLAAGGERSFSSYFHADDNEVYLIDFLKEKTVFSFHNLVADGVFAEVQLIICRNVFIYFSLGLQRDVLAKFHQSLTRQGFLGLGDKEHIVYFDRESGFREWSAKNKIYRRSDK